MWWMKQSLLPLVLPAEPTGMTAWMDGAIVTFAEHPPMLIREQFGTLLGFTIEPEQP
jgi:hypothetical protein